jgi:hypothetical protein
MVDVSPESVAGFACDRGIPKSPFLETQDDLRSCLRSRSLTCLLAQPKMSAKCRIPHL